MKDTDVEENEDISVYTLLSQLRKEKLFITKEKINIQELNETVRTKANDLIRTTWITSKQRFHLLTQREFTTQNYENIDNYANAQFIEAKNALGFQTSVKIGTLLQLLRTQPEHLAILLFLGEQTEEQIQHANLLQTIVTGLYSSCIFYEDMKCMLKLLCELAKLQLLKCSNPRVILKKGNCSFRNLYLIFHEVVPATKFFLTASLEMPVLRLLAYREFVLDLDPDKSLIRYQDDSNIRLEFKTVIDYRNEVVLRLVEFVNNFILSLHDNVYSFPKSVSWIVKQISKIIKKSFSDKESNAVVTELIFTLYICPVIVDPEQYCICDSQITDIARHNLMQIGQILQILALNELPDPKLNDVFKLLDKKLVKKFLEHILFDVEDIDNVSVVDEMPMIVRDNVLLSEQELSNLVNFLQKIHNDSITIQNENYKKSVIEDQISSLSLPSSLDNSPKSNRIYTNGLHNGSSTGNSGGSGKRPNFLNLVTKNHTSHKSLIEENSNLTVLVFPIEKESNIDPIGFLPEDKVLKMNIIKKVQSVTHPIVTNIPTGTVNSGEVVKQSFTNFPDEGSIGNTSDNLEAISEAASNHSVASSLELENEDQNDNLSDMISANVSGRGSPNISGRDSPNISGRDTPNSQLNENEERQLQNDQSRQVDIVQPRSQINRQIRTDIDDKFCKFEIKKLLEGDETISIISETWSTDVLVSDNETIDTSDIKIETRQSLQLVEQSIINEVVPNVLDISETQSESAWSTDVMASDTERLTEIDNDDAVSVTAQSDDTNSVARSDDTRSETGDGDLLAAANRRLSNVSTTTNYQEFRKMEIKNERINLKQQQTERLITTNAIDNNANNLFKTINETKPINNQPQQQQRIVTNANNKDIAGPSGCNNNNINNNNSNKRDNNTNLQYLNKNRNYDETSNEILLSNCSLNSSSSGGSNSSSSNSFENNKTTEQWDNKQWLNSSGSSLNVTSTPSESTSELSVLSVNNVNNPINGLLNKKTTTVLISRNIKPSASTGAIPKSISFDMSADKGDKYLDDEQRNKRGSFFGKLRMGFRSRRGKSFRNQDDFRLDNDDFTLIKKPSESPVKLNTNEVSEDILAKYRTKPFIDNNSVKENLKSRTGNISDDINNIQNLDLVNNSFVDIKKKLRLVLSDINIQIPAIIKESKLPIKNKIELILRQELGKAKTLKEWSNIARISEAIRCINLLNDNTCLALLESMKGDFLQRSVYMQYLINSKQELLLRDSYLDGLKKQMNHERQQCEEYLSIICVRDFLIEQESRIVQFCNEFKEISLSDEKQDYLNNFYEQLYLIMENSGLWQVIFKNRSSEIKITLERCIMSKIYVNALYPNGDGDRHRDYVLYQHIEKLSRIITPDHKDLMIHKTFLREFPWIPAQDALKTIGAYKTARDKVKCIIHCAKCIMDLLSLSQNTGSTTADDFTPVLVYVIIKVNPNDLLSTIQFVNSFYQNQLCGEEHYWWTQFCAAVEYIKTMDYSD